MADNKINKIQITLPNGKQQWVTIPDYKANQSKAYANAMIRMVDKEGNEYDVERSSLSKARELGLRAFIFADNPPQQKTTAPASQPKSAVAQQAVNFTQKPAQPYQPTWQEQAGMSMAVDQAASMGGSDVQPMVKPGLDTNILNQNNALANMAMATNLESNQDNLYLDELEKQANELAKQGLAEVNAKESEKPFSQRVFENMNSTTKAGYTSTPYTREVENNEKIRQANLIQTNVRDARKAIKDAEISQDGSWYQKLGRGLANGVDVRNFDFGITKLRNSMTLLSAANNPNDINNAILDSEALKNKIIKENEDKISDWIKAGETTTIMVPFMLQILSTPFKGLGTAASKWVMGKVGQEIAGSLGKRAALLALKGTTRFLGDTVEGAGTAAFFNTAGITADAMRRQRGNAVGQYGSDGYFHYNEMKDGEDSYAKAFAKAFGASAIEYQSELVGEYFSPLLKGIGKVAGKGLQKAGVLGIKEGFDTTGKKFTNIMLNFGGKDVSLDKTIGMITALSNKQYLKAFNDFTKATRWNGVIGEYAEEVVGNIENAALVGDMNWGTGKNGVFNPEQNWETFLSVAVGSGFMGAIGGGFYMGSRLAVNRGLKKSDKKGMELFGADAWRSIKDGFETADNPARFLAAISQNLDEPSKRAIQNYAAYSMAKKGELVADMKQRMEEPQPTNVRITPYKGRFVVQSVDPNGNIIESKDYDSEEDANIYKERVATYIDNARKVQAYNDFILRDDTEKLFDQRGMPESSRSYLNEIAYKDPLRRTEYEQEYFDDFINSIEKVTYPINEVHEEHDAQKGADLAEETSENIVEGAKPLNDREAAAKARWNAVIQSQPDIDSLVGNMVYRGMTSNEIAQRLVDDYGGESEVVEAFCELCNAKANKDGYINRIGQLIQSKVENDIDEASFAGTVNGNEDKSNIYLLTNGTNTFALIGGDITVDSNNNISSNGIAIMLDGQGNRITRPDLTGFSLKGIVDKNQYKRSSLLELQQEATAAIQATETVVPEVQQPQASEPQNEVPQQEQPQEQPQAQVEEQPQEPAATTEKESPIPLGENGEMLYHKAPIEATINYLYDGALEDEEIRDFVQNNIDESTKGYDKTNKKKPKIGTDKNAYLQAKQAWQQQVDEAKQKLDYWNSVNDYIQQQTHTTPEEIQKAQDELSGKTAQQEYANSKPEMSVTPVQFAGEFIRESKIQTQSFYNETGFGDAERKKFPKMIANDGKTIDSLAEELVSADDTYHNGSLYHGDTTEAKNAILEALQTASKKSELGKNTSDDFKEYERQREEAREAFYEENFNMSYSDYLAFEEQQMPNIWRRMSNFVAEEYDRIVNESYELRDEQNNIEQINNENNGNNTEGNRQLAGGSEVLPTEGSNQQRGTSTSTNPAAETTNGSEGGNQNEEVPGGTQGVGQSKIMSEEDFDINSIDFENNYVVAHQTLSDNAESIINSGLRTAGGLMGTSTFVSREEIERLLKTMREGHGHRGSDSLVIMQFPKSWFNGRENVKLDDISTELSDRFGFDAFMTVPSDFISNIVEVKVEKAEEGTQGELKKNSVSDNTTDTDETVNNGKLNDTATQQNTVSDNKDTTKSPNSQENQQKTDEKVEERQNEEESQPLTKPQEDTQETVETKHEVSDEELDNLFGELNDIFNGEANMVDFFSDEWGKAKPVDIGVKSGEHISLEKLKALFDKFNNGENKDVLGKLAERVFSVAQNLGLDISFVEDEKFEFGQQGKYKNDNTITYRHGFFTHPNIGNKSEVILHELIHAVTMYAMSDYRRGGNHLTPELKEACRTIYDVYEQIKNDKLFSGEYGRHDAREMIAEMANPRFRDKLKKKNLWTRIADAIKTIFGIKTDGTMQTTAFAQLDEALNNILDNFDQVLYDTYVGKKNTTVNSNTDQFKTDVTSGGLVQSPLRSPTATPGMSFDAAKVRKITETTKNFIKKFKNGEKIIDISGEIGSVISRLSRAIGMKYAGNSNYSVISTPNGTMAIRFATHNANGNNFARDNANQNVSVYVSLNEYNTPESSVPFTEYRISVEDFNAHREEIIKSIINSVDNALFFGDFSTPNYSEKIEHGAEETSPFSDNEDFFASFKELTPEQKYKVQTIGTRAAMGLIERGFTDFDSYAKEMIKRLGDDIRPFLKSFYNGARDFPGFEKYQMTPYDEVRNVDVDNFDKHEQKQEAEQPAETPEAPAAEQAKVAERKFVDNVATTLTSALETGEKPYASIVALRKAAREAGMEVGENGETDIKIQELVEDALVRVAKNIMTSAHIAQVANKANNKFAKEIFEKIKLLYNLQPTISMRSSNRIALQQYSTPLPMAFVADMFATGAKAPLFFNVFEPTAGNGMLVFAIPSSQVHVNEIDENRLDNLRGQEFRQVTTQDATQPFAGDRKYNAIITNPPFGSTEAKDYDGYSISGLAPQIALNALDKMKDNGKAVIIIGGKQEFAPNGAIKNDKPFLAYLYNNYNVKGVIDMDGSLYAKQGTTFPTRMILIDGRRTEEERAKSDVYPPTIKNWINPVADFDRLYDTVNDLINSKEKTNGTEIVHAKDESLQSDRSVTLPGNTDKGTDSRKPVQDVATTGRGLGPNRGNGKSPKGDNPQLDLFGSVLGGSGELSDKEPNGDERGLGRPAGRDNGTGGKGVDNRLPVDATVSGVHGTAERRMGLTQEQEKRSLESEKLPYRSHNGAFSLESVAPAAMVEAMDKTLKRIEEEYGNIDEFVTSELGYDSIDAMHKALAAEQVDSVAMAIYNMKKGEALIIGDQTGVGKGRQMAALIRWAHRQGKKPIFMTKYDYLADDIYRDLKDIGCGDFKPFIFNDYKISEIIKDKEGKERKKTIFKPATPKQITEALQNGKIPDDYDYVLCTYYQISTGDDISREYENNLSKEEDGGSRRRTSRTPKPGAKPRKQTKAVLLRKLAKGNYLMLDESHTAAGESNQGFYMQTLVRDSKAVTFASATYAKRPDTMPLYALRTAMSKANIGMKKLIEAIQKGGVTLQEVMSRALTNSGQMVRRERDMEGVVTDWTTIDDPETVKKARENYDKTIKAFNAIIDFQKKYIEPFIDNLREDLAVVAGNAGFVRGTETMGISNTPFANKTYNYTKQLMLALKVNAIVDEVDRQIKAGRKPVIALDNTMGSMIDELSVGDEVTETTFAASLLRGLDSIMQYSRDSGNGGKSTLEIKPSELSAEGQVAYHELVSFIKESTKDIFISPLDEITAKLRAKGYNVGELTGRENVVVEDNGRFVVQKRGETDKAILQNRFNNGNVDVLILNKSASTGISLHASNRFTDQRQRVMILAQPLPDIAEYMQMIGRIDRTGQVKRGYYINLGLPVPAEQRFLMMLSTKLKSLNANTTTSQESKDNKVDAPDMLNKYGSQVIVEYFKDNPEIYNKLGDPLKLAKTNKSLTDYQPSSDDSDARKLTGYVALLSTDEQQAFYDDVIERYNNLIKYLDDSGTNDLKITSLPLNATTLARAVSSEGNDPTGDNPFAQNAYVEKVEMDVLRKPMKANEINNVINTIAKGKDPKQAVEDIKAQYETEFKAKLDKQKRKYETDLERNKETLKKYEDKINGSEKMSDEDKQKAIEDKKESLQQDSDRKNDNAISSLEYEHERMIRALDLFKVGGSYLIPDNLDTLAFDLTSHGIFLGYKAKDNGITPSSTIAVFATLDGRRRVEIKLSEGNKIANVNTTTNQNYDAAQQVNLTNWDNNIPNITRKTGYIITGNILQAINDSQDENGNFTGQLVSYTDSEGNIHDGVLMPDKWEPTMMVNAGNPISSAKADIESGKTVISINGEVEIVPVISRYYPTAIYLRVPRSKKLGAKYYENEDLIRAIDEKEFYQNSGKLQTAIPNGKLDEVLSVLSKMGVKVPSDIVKQLTPQQDNSLAYSSSTNNVNNPRIIPEDVDKDVSLQIESEFDSAIENLNLTEEEKNELENLIGEFSNLGTNDLEYTFYLNNSRLRIRDEKKNNLSEMLWRRGNSVSPSAANVGGNLRDEKSGAESPTTANGEYSAVVSRQSRETERENTSRGNEVQGQYNGPRDIRNTGSDRLLLHEGRRIEEKVVSQTPRTRLSSHQRRLLAAQYAISRELVYRDIRLAAIKESLGLEAGKQTSLDDVAKIFEKYNKNKEVKALFDKILAINKRLGTSVEILESDENGNYGSAGTRRDVRYYLDGFTRTSSNQNVNIPLVIAHELLHQGTVGAINLVRKGKAEGVLTKEQIDAVNTILDIYNKVKANEGILSESKRGLANPYEFAAQMVDPRQRRALSMSPLQRIMAAANELKAQGNNSLWERIKNALKSLFGLSDLKKMDNAINTLLDTFNETVHDISMADVDQNGWGYKIEDKETLDKLNSEPTVKVYRAMQVIDGKLYPPMAAKVNGSLVEPTKVGEWYGADEHPELIIQDGTYKDGTPKYKFKLDKGGKDATGKKATDVKAAYNPYWHTSRSPINDQFKSAWIRPNLVTVEVEVPESELTSGYKAQYAKDAVGEVEWKSGSVSGELAKLGNPRKVILSRYNRVVRVVPVEEVADRFKEMLDGTGIEVPENTVTPQLRTALEEKGVKIGAPEKGVNKDGQIEEALAKGLDVDNSLRYRKASEATKTEKASAKTQQRMREKAKSLVKSLNTPVKIVTSDEAPERAKNAKGYYDTRTGEVVIVLDNNQSVLDIEKTVVHEIIGHHGLRGLLGSVRNYRQLMNVIYDSLPEEQKTEIKDKAMRNGYKFYEAMDEYFAEQAENMVWDSSSATMWDNIKHYITEAIHKLGFILRPNYRDVRYWMWLSKNNLQSDNPLSEIKRQAFLHKLSRLDAPKFDDNFYETENDSDIDYTEPETLFRNGKILDGTTRQIIEQRLKQKRNVLREGFIDFANGLRIMQEEMDKGIKGGIVDNQDAYHSLLASSSKVEEAQDVFKYTEIAKLQNILFDIYKFFDGKTIKEKYNNIINYIYKKHSLERNRVLFFRDWFRDNLKKKIEKLEDLPTEAYEIYEKKVIGIETDFEDGKIDKAQRDKALQDAVQESWLEYLENANNGFGKLHNILADKVDNKTITLADMYRQLDEYINQFTKYDPSKHDYSGLTAFAKMEGKEFDDAKFIEEVMAIEDSINRNDNKILGKFQNAIHAITQKGLDENLRSGLISKSAYDRASSMFRWYVPLRGFNQDTMEDMFKYDYSNKVEAGNVLKNAEGRLTLAWDPLSTATSMALNSISSAEKNLVKQAAYRLVNHWIKENPNEKPFAVVSDVWYRKNEKGEWEIVVPKFAENSSDKDITEQTNRWIEDMRTLEREGKTKRKVNKGDFIAPFSNKDNMRSNIVYLRINGQQKMIIFNGNPKVARILNAEMNPEIVPYWDELMRGMSALNTVFSITFTGTNFLRDTQFANNNIFNKENSIYHNEFTQNQAMLMGKVWGKSGYLRMYKAYKNGTLGNSKLEQYFREFMQHGGKTGISKYYTLEDAEKLIDYSFDKSRGMHYVKLPFNTAADFIEAVNERAENINRLAAYITSREMGRSVKRSISDAKEVTVNFNRKGASWKTAKYGNTKFEKAVGLMAWIYRHGYMFFNAGVQALYALGYNLKNNPVKTLTTVAAIPFLGGILMHVINELLIAASGGDDDDYANLSPWTRRNNLCIYLPTGTFLKIPLPIELRAFYGLADIAYSTFDNRYATGVNPWVEALSQISAVLPVDYTAAFSGNLTLYDVIAPDAFKPIIQAKENKDWTGAPLHKEPQFYNKYDANWTLAFDSENRIAVGLAKWANSIGNRDETNVSKGRFDFHPSTLSNIFEGYFGSAGKDFMRLFDIPSDPLNTYNWPFFRGFLQTPSDKNKYTRIKLKYNFYRDNAMEYKEMIDNYKKSENPDLVRKAYSEEFKNTLDYRMMQEVDKFIKKYEKPYNKEKKKEKYSEKEKKILDEAFMLEKKQLIETLEEMERTSDE